MTRLISAALLAAALAGTGRAWAGAGAEPFDFLSLDANARAVAMGGAYSALARDANALLYNPGGLGRIERHEATFMHNQAYQGVSQEYAALAVRQGWGAHINYLSFGGVPRTTVSNPDGAGLGDTGLTDLAFSGGYGRVVVPGLAVGGALKYIRESIDKVSAAGYALDLGALYSVERAKGLSLAASVQNIGPAVKFQNAKENLPLTIRAGAAYEATIREQRCAAAIDIIKERSETVAVAFGAELVAARRFPIRFGYAGRNDAGIGLTAGFGYRHDDFSVDYAFVPYGGLGDAHRISLSVRWGGFR